LSESADRAGRMRALYRNDGFTPLENLLIDALYMVAYGSFDQGAEPDLTMCRMLAAEALETVGEHVPGYMKVYRN